MREELTVYGKLQAGLEAAAGRLASRRDAWRMVALAIGAGSVTWAPDGEAGKRKKKGKKKKKTDGCVSPYFSCGGTCKLAGACCDAIPELNCAAQHPNEPGTSWVCCEIGNSCADVMNDFANCGACYNRCPQGSECLNGTCVQ